MKALFALAFCIPAGLSAPAIARDDATREARELAREHRQERAAERLREREREEKARKAKEAARDMKPAPAGTGNSLSR